MFWLYTNNISLIFRSNLASCAHNLTVLENYSPNFWSPVTLHTPVFPSRAQDFVVLAIGSKPHISHITGIIYSGPIYIRYRTCTILHALTHYSPPPMSEYRVHPIRVISKLIPATTSFLLDTSIIHITIDF